MANAASTRTIAAHTNTRKPVNASQLATARRIPAVGDEMQPLSTDLDGALDKFDRLLKSLEQETIRFGDTLNRLGGPALAPGEQADDESPTFVSAVGRLRANLRFTECLLGRIAGLNDHFSTVV